MLKEMKKILTLLFLTFSSVLFGQKIDSTKIKQTELYQKILYDTNSDSFKKQKYYSKLDNKYKFPWLEKKHTTNQLKSALDTLIQNSTLEIKEESVSKFILKFNSYFPTYIDDVYSELFKLTIKNYRIKNLNDSIIKIGRGITGIGMNFSSGYKNGKSYSYIKRTINTSFNIRSEVEVQKEDLKGEILFNSRFVKGYDYIKIEKSDIGKPFLIGKIEFTVVDIIESTIILDFKQSIEDATLLEFANIDDNGNKIVPIEYFDFQKLKNDGKVPSDIFHQTETLQTMNKSLINLFRSNPNLSFADFKELTHKNFVEIVNSKNQKETAKKVFGKEYVLFHLADKIQNFYLYIPKYIEKEFKMKLPEK